jgi:putative peptidoglycan lipid II flippase
VRELARRAAASLGYAALNSLRFFMILVVANGVPGGVVAFQLALNIIFLPVAITAWPVSVALMPQLSRLYLAEAAQRFRDELVRGAALMFFLVIPATAAVIALADPISRAVSFGEMATPRGVTLVAASVAALGPSVFGEASWMFVTFASYSRKDARAPFHSMILRTTVTFLGLLIAFLFVHGTALLVAMGLAVSTGTMLGCWHLVAGLSKRLPPSGERLTPAMGRDVVASLVMLVPAYLLARGVPDLAGGRTGHVLALVVAVAVGLAVYLGIQRLWHAAELEELRDGFGQLRSRSAT